MSLTVIIGPPASGKTTWVLDRAGAHDIVIDYDRLAVALAGTGAPTHRHPKVLKEVTMVARRAALREALKHAAAVDVYLIHTHPAPHDLAAYRRDGATLVVMDPGQDVVTARCRTERTTGHLAAVTRWYTAKARGDFADHRTPVQPAGASRRW
ncbi:hypothetical protein [Nocardiopsis sp. NPDC057823]|uniref:hypothetical protein n=1 Tax=Nocardiopsis sp. NPDC057823 TaxID=3346256 RepID=UPI0036726175